MKTAKPAAKPAVKKKSAKKSSRVRAAEPLSPAVGEAPQNLAPAVFQKKLITWYRKHARELPWRGINDPYATWLSEIMLQQTRVAAVIERYVEFRRRFPTLSALAAAEESQVLALWSGLGYYRRARMLHKAAQFVERELGGELPGSADELRTLPGIGDYTAAAIASIAFGESIAVVDGNVERVLLRIIGEPEEKSAAARTRMQRLAQTLVPRASAKGNAPGDHNQAMMELGATVCTPKSPLCLQCPVLELCRTRGEHVTLKREKQQVRRVAYLLAVRRSPERTQVLLEQRPPEASLMPGMFELPPLPLEATFDREPVLRVRHSITNTNYEVEIYSGEEQDPLLAEIPAALDDLHWASTTQFGLLPLTGLARKCLLRMRLMPVE